MHQASAAQQRVRPFKDIHTVSKDQKFFSWEPLWREHLVVEIGCGAGLHPIRWTKQNPRAGMVAIERTKTKSMAFEQRVAHHQRDNLYKVNADATHWLPAHIKPGSVDAYFLLYPNPYPKESQSNKRWHRSPFFHFLLASLKPEGEIHMVTNEEFYAKEFRHYCKRHWNLTTLVDRSLKGASDFEPRTHFERKYLAREQTCYDFIVSKKTIEEQ